MAPGQKLEVHVVMCCQGCVDKVEDVLNETPGVSDYKTERYYSLVIITETPSGGPDRKQLVKKLKRATHDKKAVILPPRPQTPTGTNPTPTGTNPTPTGTNPTPTGTNPTPTVVYTGYPYMQGPGYLVPWPASAPSSSSPFITNPNYFQHPVRCGNCWRYSDIVCANCGRGSNFS